MPTWVKDSPPPYEHHLTHRWAYIQRGGGGGGGGGGDSEVHNMGRVEPNGVPEHGLALKE
jgi:hypothetical protein